MNSEVEKIKTDKRDEFLASIFGFCPPNKGTWRQTQKNNTPYSHKSRKVHWV